MGRINKLQVLVAVVGIGWPAVGSAQLYQPLDTVPKPNLVVGFDTSVTMRINSGCTSCHWSTTSRLDEAKADILTTLPIFDPYFDYGYFEYRGCGTAHTQNHVQPRGDGTSNLGTIMGLIGGASACNSKERRLPGVAAGTCLTPGCLATDFPVLNAMATNQLNGFNPFSPFIHMGCAFNPTSVGNPCQSGGTDVDETVTLQAVGTGAGGLGCFHHTNFGSTNTCNLAGAQAAFIASLATFNWPRWEPSSMDPNRVRVEFCNPMRNAAQAAWAALQSCFASFGESVPQITNGDVMSAINSNTFCDHNQIAATGCQPGSPLFNTCVCDDTIPGCEIGAGVSACNTTLTWKARQQVAVCELRRDTGGNSTFYDFYQSQPDNVVNAGCRENAGLLFTDGYMGHTPGTIVESALALPHYISSNPIGNLAVFRISSVFASSANTMMGALTNGVLGTAYDATNLGNMQEAFASLLNRMYQGNYTGAAMTMDTYGNVAVTTSFSVPGYRGFSQPTDTYLGWPQRVAMHSVNPTTGAIGPALWESDWSSKASSQLGCYSQFYGPSQTPITNGSWITANRGPDDAFSNGVNRSVNVAGGTFERDNFGGTNPAALRFGRMYGTATTRPVIVERGSSDVGGLRSALYRAHLTAIQNRPRMIYTMGGGYVYAIHGGDAQITASNQQRITYNAVSANAGREVFRYSPEFVDQGRGYSPSGTYNPGANSTGNVISYDPNVNPIVPQPMTTGQLTAREVLIDVQNNNQPVFRTILVGAQGGAGRGFFAMDVTDPCTPDVLAEWALPNGSATNEPMIYEFPRDPLAPAPTNGVSEYFSQPAVVVTDGLGSTAPRIYAFNPATGGILSARALPGGTDYPTEPVCVDVVGNGYVTHCYVVAQNGTLVRVGIDGTTGQFTSSTDITPATVDRSQTYSTRPAVFFGVDGAVNVLYGSGDFANLNNPAGGNAVYKAIDTDSRLASISTAPADATRACDNALVPNGVLNIGTERVLAPPMITKGVVAWTTYEPGTNGCIAGQGRLYAMDFATCRDAIDPTPATPQAPAGQGVGDGIPTAPVLHSKSASLVASTSVVVEGSQATTVNNVRTKGLQAPAVRRLYWKLERPNP
ncbi:MAG: hypothetical protein RMA76_35810 [Deltaproteobacteria bacterium]|jgi:hypothetical protein